jgi:hypothetical protein
MSVARLTLTNAAFPTSVGKTHLGHVVLTLFPRSILFCKGWNNQGFRGLHTAPRRGYAPLHLNVSGGCIRAFLIAKFFYYNFDKSKNPHMGVFEIL